MEQISVQKIQVVIGGVLLAEKGGIGWKHAGRRSSMSLTKKNKTKLLITESHLLEKAVRTLVQMRSQAGATLKKITTQRMSFSMTMQGGIS